LFILQKLSLLLLSQLLYALFPIVEEFPPLLPFLLQVNLCTLLQPWLLQPSKPLFLQ
jgi:hypothetical protein